MAGTHRLYTFTCGIMEGVKQMYLTLHCLDNKFFKLKYKFMNEINNVLFLHPVHCVFVTINEGTNNNLDCHSYPYFHQTSWRVPTSLATHRWPASTLTLTHKSVHRCLQDNPSIKIIGEAQTSCNQTQMADTKQLLNLS